MSTKNMPSPLLKTSESLDEIRDIILGPHLQTLKLQIEQLFRQIEAYGKQSAPQRNDDRRFKRMRTKLNNCMDQYVRRAVWKNSGLNSQIKDGTNNPTSQQNWVISLGSLRSHCQIRKDL